MASSFEGAVTNSETKNSYTCWLSRQNNCSF